MERADLIKKIAQNPDNRLTIYLAVRDDHNVEKAFFTIDQAQSFIEGLPKRKKCQLREATLRLDNSSIRIEGDKLSTEIISPQAIIPSLLGIDETPCYCLNFNSPNLDYSLYNALFDRREIGIDMTNSRYGEVALMHCHKCARIWLHYYVNYEGFEDSARWYLGIITAEIATRLTPENAAKMLEDLDWHFFGGSYFTRKGWSSYGIHVDL